MIQTKPNRSGIRISLRLLLCGVLCALLNASCAVAIKPLSTNGPVVVLSSPALTLITPRGVQRGATHTLRFSGARLETAQEVFLYDSPGIKVHEIKKINANNVDVTVEVSPETRLGEHVAQIRTLHGISDY